MRSRLAGEEGYSCLMYYYVKFKVKGKANVRRYRKVMRRSAGLIPHSFTHSSLRKIANPSYLLYASHSPNRTKDRGIGGGEEREGKEAEKISFLCKPFFRKKERGKSGGEGKKEGAE